MNVLKHYMSTDMARNATEMIRECYDKHDKRDVCCNCGRKEQCSNKCNICRTNTYCKHCESTQSACKFLLCRSQFEECEICGYMIKSKSIEYNVDLTSLNVELWEQNLKKLLPNIHKYTYKYNGELTDEMKTVLNQFGISARMI